MLPKNLQKGAQMTEDQQEIAIGLGASTCSISASGFEPEPKALNILVILWTFVSTRQQRFPVTQYGALYWLGLVKKILGHRQLQLPAFHPSLARGALDKEG